jgi:threonine/homoserine/homoserine lactone efflux protein
MAITAVTVYTPDDRLASAVLIAVLFGLVNLPSVGVWTLLGLHLRKLLTNPRRLRTFNVAMALLLVASLWPVLAT